MSSSSQTLVQFSFVAGAFLAVLLAVTVLPSGQASPVPQMQQQHPQQQSHQQQQLAISPDLYMPPEFMSSPQFYSAFMPLQQQKRAINPFMDSIGKRSSGGGIRYPLGATQVRSAGSRRSMNEMMMFGS